MNPLYILHRKPTLEALIFCTSYISPGNETHDWVRYNKWINYYSPRMESLNANFLFLIDDGSKVEFFPESINLIAYDQFPPKLNSRINVIRFDNHLGRPSPHDYPGWWRSFTFSLKLAENYGIKKIIHIESDFFIVSQKMLNYIKGLHKGWTVFFSRHYNFPETGIQVICKDSYNKLYDFYSRANENSYKFDDIAENLLPFSKVQKKFTGDRYGEDNVLNSFIGLPI